MSRFKGVAEQVIRDVRTGWRQIVKDLGGVDATAKVAQTTISQVSIYGSITGDSLPSLATVLAAEIDLGPGHAHVTEAMARATGHALVAIRPMADGDLDLLVARLGSETGQVFTGYLAAKADGRICGEDRAALLREAQDVLQAAHLLIGHLQAPPAAVPAERTA